MRGAIQRFVRLVHTVRHLRPVQLYGRLRFRLYRPRPDEAAAPSVRLITQPLLPLPARQPSLLGPSNFRFLSEEGAVERASDWSPKNRERLWVYHLHYFDDLNADGAAHRNAWHRGLIERWVRENPPGRGVGWEPYPTALRMVNWIKWALAGNPLAPTWRQSLAVQARWLTKRLEWHLLGNHLFVNAKALVFAGLFFEGREATGWMEQGLRILQRQIPEQILPDGGHFELSPMYHALAEEDLLDLIHLARAYPGAVPQRWRGSMGVWVDRVCAMQEWLSALCHEDGEIAFFNDAAMGVAPVSAELAAYGQRLEMPSAPRKAAGILHLSDSGYVRVRRGPALALLDVAAIGPDYLPGHAHADTLSFELSLFQHRVLVNSGTSLYGVGPERQRQRSTPAHNTVTVDGENSSDVWSGFRVGQRARPFGLQIEENSDQIRVRCGHDGYRRLRGRPVHWREWRLAAGELVVSDEIQGRYREAVARYHFHPLVKVECGADCHSGRIYLPGDHVVRWEVKGGRASLSPSTHHPRFGASEGNHVLAVCFSHPACEVRFAWT